MIDLDRVGWSEADVPRAWTALADAVGSAGSSGAPSETAAPVASVISVDPRWIVEAAESVAVHAKALSCRYAELSDVLARCAPALVRLEREGERRYLAVVRSSSTGVRVITPQLVECRIPLALVRQGLASELERPARLAVDAWMEHMRVRRRRLQGTREALLSVMLADRPVDGVWLLEVDPGAGLGVQMHRMRVRRRVLFAWGCGIAQVGSSAVAWLILGRAALSGLFEPGWILAWALACGSAALCEIGALWFGGGALTDAATRIKRRLFAGALRAPAEYVHDQGPGRLLGLVAETEAIETAALRGTFAASLALLQLLGSLPVLWLGAGGAVHVALLLGVGAFVGVLGFRYLRARDRWSEQRLALSRDFVENTVGQRTRVAQQQRSRWHGREDPQLRAYHAAAHDMDRWQQRLTSLPARSFFALALLALTPALLLNEPDASALALALGGSIQAYTALAALGACVVPLAAAVSGWQRIRTLYAAAAGALPRQARGERVASEPSLEARAVTFRHPDRPRAALEDCSLVLRYGERILLEGPSGAGKTTLVSVLLGLQRPAAGHVLLDGMDRSILGAEAWRRSVASAPQFNQNHIFNASLAFNLLLGGRWPATDRDRREALDVCGELGLGSLLDRMPSGLDQIVGESGWQLSHGERSRVFVARAILQRAAVLVLDESFGTLDAPTLRRCLEALRARPSTLVVVAHL